MGGAGEWETRGFAWTEREERQQWVMILRRGLQDSLLGEKTNVRRSSLQITGGRNRGRVETGERALGD